MAILLRSPFHYRTHLVEALRRAGIPAHFSRGTVLPEPGGRALLVLLRCAAEGLSAVRFAEYLSLGVAPAASTLADGQSASSTRLSPTDEVMAALLGRERDDGTVASQSPQGGGQAPVGAEVNIVIWRFEPPDTTDPTITLPGGPGDD